MEMRLFGFGRLKPKRDDPLRLAGRKAPRARVSAVRARLARGGHEPEIIEPDELGGDPYNSTGRKAVRWSR